MAAAQVFVFTITGQLVDELALRGAMRGASKLSGTALNVLGWATVIGAGGVLFVLLLGLLRRRFSDGVLALVAFAGAVISSQLIKYHLLLRPGFGIGYAKMNSYPSGHATLAASLAVALLLVVPTRWRGPIAWCATAAVTLFGYATMIAGWHRPSDVLGAVLLAGVWGYLVLALRPLSPAPHTGRGWLLPALGTLGLAAGAVLMATVHDVSDMELASRNDVLTASLGGAAASAGTTALVLGVLSQLVAHRAGTASQRSDSVS